MPPPGFGPKLDKKKQAAAEEDKVLPPSERYSIRLERQEEELLRSVLEAAQKHAPAPACLLRDQKKLHHLYGQLLRRPVEASSRCCRT